MSDTSILPTADTGSAMPGVPAPLFDDDPGDDRRRLMIIGGIVAGVLVLVVGYLLLHGGGGSSDDATGVVARGTPHAVSSPAHASTDGSGKATDSGTKAGTKLPKASNRRLAKDPFKALVVPNKGGSGADAGTGTGVGTGVGTGTTSAANVIPPGTPTAIRFVKLTVDSSGNQVAEFAVTYSGPHSVAIFDEAPPAAGSTDGTVFANVFSLLGVQGSVVTIQIGDDTPFDLRKGASHSV
jgi:hypothetical protein